MECLVNSELHHLTIMSNFIDEIINQAKKEKYQSVPPIALYYQIYLTHTEPEIEGHYFKLKELLDKHGLKFPINSG